ncbi:DUF2325 domain-containing protein [Magnetococcus sp. PR-3]|uniref:DUF2325 domain-containing protein n=1 Tax=Magnetococcus sp. PR-3 TaxID=3120355 RepID=UPI002FCE3848
MLYVGGITHIGNRYKQLVTQQNGELIHHDGGVGDSRARLEALVSRADAVFCPVDCISHDACLKIKKQCKHQDKPFIPLRSSGLASFSRGLQNLTQH